MRTLHPENHVQKALQDSRIPLGTFNYFRDPSVMELLGTAGLDFVIIDTEHAVMDPESVERQIAAAQLNGLTPYVRVAQIDAPAMRRCLELGAQGILVPHIRSRADCLAAQDAMRYPPAGNASTCRSIRSTGYDATRWTAYLQWAAQASLVALIEDPEAMGQLDAILDALTPGRDMVMFGKADFSQSLGLIGSGGSVDGSQVDAASCQVADACRQRGLTFWIVPAGQTAEAIQKELRCPNTAICLGVDQSILLGAYRAAAAQMKQAAAQTD